MSKPAKSLDDVCARYDLSNDQCARLRAFDEIFMETQSHTNLVARNSLPDRWDRHYADSLQLLEGLPTNLTSWLDVGSGAGFPGLLAAAVFMDRSPGTQFILCDSVKKKARFLTAAASAMGLSNVSVVDHRAEAFHVKHRRFDIITARAVTGLDGLLDLCAPILAKDGLLIFPKGEKADEELTRARERWTFDLESRPSHTHDRARILTLRSPEPRS